MNSPVATPTPAELTLTILSGPDTGAAYKIVSTKVTLGRASDNSIVIKDPRCSRYHAEIDLTNEGITITDKSTQNPVEVDGKAVRKAALVSGSIITLGSTVLRFDIRTQGGQANLPASVVSPAAKLEPQSLPQSPASQSGTPSQRVNILTDYNDLAPNFQGAKPGGNRVIFYLIVAAVGGGLYWFLATDSDAKKRSSDIRSDTQIDEDLKAAQERKDAIIKVQREKGVGTVEYDETQATYLQGFRDYREGNFSRAVMSFESVLALNPKHELAQKYRELSKRRLDESIETSMRDGRRLMEQGKYSQAMASYRQVMTLLQPDVQNKRYKEANSLYNECELLLKGAY